MLILYYDTDWKFRICGIDTENQKMGNEYKFNSQTENLIFFSGGNDYGICCYDNEKMYSADIVTGEKSTILNWFDTGIVSANIQSVAILPENKIIVSYYDSALSGSHAVIFEKTEAENVKSRTVINIGMDFVENSVYSAVMQFNKENQDYIIKITDYSLYNSEDRKKMLSENFPDIFLTDGKADFSYYAKQGLLSDMYEFMDNDSEVKRSDYLENALEAFSIDGKLVSISPFFNINTIAGKKSAVVVNDWNTEEFIKYAEGISEEVQLFNDEEMTAEGIMEMFCYGAVNDFIDYENHTCDFDNKEFVKIIEFAGKHKTMAEHSAEISNVDYNAYYDEMYAKYKTGEILFKQYVFGNVEGIYQAESADFGGELSFTGIPSEERTSYMSSSFKLGISSKSENKEMAWNFVKQFLKDEYQNNKYGFPVKKSVFEETVSADFSDIGIDEATSEKYINFINSVRIPLKSDMNIVQIIDEETYSYFSKNQSADETAKNIQQRVTEYLK